MAQLIRVECLLKCEALSSNPSTDKNKNEENKGKKKEEPSKQLCLLF
jgi:hypothetical protein